MIRSFILLIILVLTSFIGRASHVFGGDLTWTCQGGDYVFQLTVYRDCNGAVVNTSLETIEVWGHPTVSSIPLNFVSQTDVSPFCTEVTGGPISLDCGTGQAGGNGIGAIEKAIYKSAPITLTGTPPPEGWVFTFQNFSRSGSLTNITNPSTYGITITAKMFAIPGSPGTCVDNSPQFLQEPYFVSCVGDPYEYNMNGIDPDLDSLYISFGIPYDYFPAQVYTPGVFPAPVPFEPGFSYTSPTPDATMNPGNISAQLDPSSGNLTFLTNNTGNFTVKIVAQSFRNGVLIAEVERELQLIVLNCSGTNTAPSILGPFAGLFETTVNAGTLVSFNLASTDVEVLQDGTPQDNILSATGPMFGTNFTSNSGCAIAPCATLDATPLITMSQGVNTDFNWQTTCDHLVNPYGFVAEMIPYHFVFKVQDDYCQVPKVSYATVTINVLNPGVIPAPQINCIQSDSNGDVTINWSIVNDPLGTFNSYEIYSLQNGLIATIANINTSSYTDPGILQANDYYIATASGCNGNTRKYSDTLSNIFLDLNNPMNGTALLQWNDPVTPPLSSMNSYYHIYREYPATTWTLYDSVPFGTHFYIDTISICSVFLNYQIVLPNQPCDYTSNITGDNFEDMISPDIPVLTYVTIDSLTNEVTIEWNENSHQDTYGYIIYIEDITGSIVQLDVVFGISTTSYIYSPVVSNGPLTYSVAAFDSCLTSNVPPTYQTSAKAEVHTTIFVTSQLNLCERTVTLTWSDYVGWNDLDQYTIYGKNTSQGWTIFGATTATSFTIDVAQGEDYSFIIEATSIGGLISHSNTTDIFISTPELPAFNYLKVATVDQDQVELRYYIDATADIEEVSIQKLIDGQFAELERIPVTGNNVTYIDEDVEVDETFYVYRFQVVDSCGSLGEISNEAQTILLSAENDEVKKLNYLTWTPYREYAGSILGYDLFRGYDGVFNSSPIATLPDGEFHFNDDVNDVVSRGRICYYVEAVESFNMYGFSEISRSNESCITLPPIIYVPNAFVPEGVNTIFKPVLSDFDPADYDFTIFDRWGQAIYRTNVPSEGWDGRISFSGEMAATGTYLYMLTLRDGDGIEIIKRGHVTLLK